MPDILTKEFFGSDHWSTLLYAENRAVDASGSLGIADPRMRKAGRRGVHFTRLAEGLMHDDPDHDDYACLADMQAVGLLTYDGQKVTLTDEGWRIARHSGIK